jgi:hypothetical protein
MERIDTHCHVIPDVWRKYCNELGPVIQLDARYADMCLIKQAWTLGLPSKASSFDSEKRSGLIRQPKLHELYVLLQATEPLITKCSCLFHGFDTNPAHQP